MMNFLLTSTVALALTLPSMPAQAGGKEWCEQNTGTCVFWGVVGGLFLLALAGDGDSSDSGSVDEDGDYVPPPGRNAIDLGLSEPLPQADYSNEYGCAWGSRATGTCN